MPNTYDPIKVDEDYFPEHETEQEAFYQQLNALPRDVADILLMPETAEMLEKISKEKRLSVAQSQELSRLVRKIAVADIYLGDIVKEVQNKLSVNEASAKEVANSLVSEVFASALEELKKLHVQKFGRPAAGVAQAFGKQGQVPEGTSDANIGKNVGTGTANPLAPNPSISNQNNIVNLRNKN